jgi:hypothetical protein
MNDPVRKALRRIIDEYTPSVCSDHRRFENLMRDLCSQHRREVSILSRALSERVAADLLMWHDSVPRAVMVARLARRLEVNLALTQEAAIWAVERWAEVLLESGGSPLGRWYQFSGEGDAANLEPFALDSGVAFFETEYDGSDNLIVDLLNQAGRHHELAANVIGKGSVTKPVAVPDGGDFRLGVRSRGKWSVEVRQSATPIAHTKPVTFTGTGQQATPFVHLEDGISHFKAAHRGAGNFVVRLLSGGGRLVELVANEIGTCRTSREVLVDSPGSYVLDVSAEGDWEVRVR